jgi:TfoX/Sxy family transcriptional regulator of competence genes
VWPSMTEPGSIGERFAGLVAELTRLDGVTFGAGRRAFGSGTLQVDGRIFAMVSDDRLVLKLPRDRVAELVASGEGSPFDAGKGRPLAEWLTLGDADDARWRLLAREAASFVGRAGRG